MSENRNAANTVPAVYKGPEKRKEKNDTGQPEIKT